MDSRASPGSDRGRQGVSHSSCSSIGGSGISGGYDQGQAPRSTSHMQRGSSSFMSSRSSSSDSVDDCWRALVWEVLHAAAHTHNGGLLLASVYRCFAPLGFISALYPTYEAAAAALAPSVLGCSAAPAPSEF